MAFASAFRLQLFEWVVEVMGIDAQGYVRISSDTIHERIAALNDEFRECFDFNIGWKDDGKNVLLSFRDDGDLGPIAVIAFGLDRFWGPGYERGPFEKHLTILGWLRRHRLVEEVYYGGDCSDFLDFQQYDSKLEQDYLEHWFVYGHRPYRSAFK